MPHNFQSINYCDYRGSNVQPQPFLQRRIVVNGPAQHELKEAYGLAQSNGEDMCVVCLTNKPNVILKPCQHVNMCNECTAAIHSQSHVAKCPNCRQRFTDFEVFKIVE